MIGVRVVEAYDVQAALAGLALDADQLRGIDVVAVVGGVGAGVAGADDLYDFVVAFDGVAEHKRRSTHADTFLLRGRAGLCSP